MSYFRPCPYCGASLDPGEACDCPRATEARQVPTKQSKRKTKTKQVLIVVDSNGAAKACNW